MIKLNEMIIVFPSAPDTCIILWIYPWRGKQARLLHELMIMIMPQTGPSPPAVSVCALSTPQTAPRTFPSPLAAPIPPASGSYWSTSISCPYWFISSSCSYGSTSLNLESSASFCGHSWTWLGSSHTYMGFGLRTPSMVCCRVCESLAVFSHKRPASCIRQLSECVWIMRIVLDLTEAFVRCKSRQKH